jgi:class 3 adenylate cyclase/tetratricopeptide (TPR) repeat protein
MAEATREALANSTSRDHRRLAAIVAADVVGYSRLMGRDEGGTLAALKAHRRELIDPKIAEYGGRIVKTTGDGLLLEFASVVDAVRCAVDVQRGMAERNAPVPPAERIAFRVGINVGDIIFDEEDIFGDGVNVAARLQTLAEPGGICASRAVRDHVLDKLDFAFDDLGAKAVKNIARPVQVFRIAYERAPGARVRAAIALPRRLPAWGKTLLLVVAVLAGTLGAWQAATRWRATERVAPYSAQDRRMTFAVLPIEASAGDAELAKIAVDLTQLATARLETRTRWAQVVPRAVTEQALARGAPLKEIATALDTHFLVRGNLARAAPAYTLEMLVIDGASGRVLDAKSLNVDAPALTPRQAQRLDQVLWWLTYQGLRVEVERARSKPDKALDVRDLAFRAFVEWTSHPEQDPKQSYSAAVRLLERALALAPDDKLALFMMAEVNLCDCVEGWSRNVDEQRALGAEALDRYLQRNPADPTARTLKGNLYALRGRYEESLLIVDEVLEQEPENREAIEVRVFDLLKLGRLHEARTAVNHLLLLRDDGDANALAAAVHFQIGDDARAAQMAQLATTRMNRRELQNPSKGSVTLTWAAAEARLGHAARATAALAAFHEAAPGVETIAGIRAWMHPTAYLASYPPLIDALRLAGVPD